LKLDPVVVLKWVDISARELKASRNERTKEKERKVMTHCNLDLNAGSFEVCSSDLSSTSLQVALGLFAIRHDIQLVQKSA
jgi:hypothetical protein